MARIGLVTCYNDDMVRHVDAIFSQGTFRPLQPLALPEGTRVHLRVEEQPDAASARPAPRIRTPKLAHPEEAGDFVMQVRESDDAGL